MFHVKQIFNRDLYRLLIAKLYKGCVLALASSLSVWRLSILRTALLHKRFHEQDLHTALAIRSIGETSLLGPCRNMLCICTFLRVESLLPCFRLLYLSSKCLQKAVLYQLAVLLGLFDLGTLPSKGGQDS